MFPSYESELVMKDYLLKLSDILNVPQVHRLVLSFDTSENQVLLILNISFNAGSQAEQGMLVGIGGSS